MTTSRIDIQGLSKSYGTHSVLHAVSATFRAGRVAALVGANGAGKTTLLRIVAGLQRADEGLVSGDRALYFGGFDTVPSGGTINALRRALRLSSIEGGERLLGRLSRGELHRVGLSIAFECARSALLLDEPWTALEPDARETLNDEIRSAASSRVVICSSHDLDEVARIADDVVFLGNGQLTWTRREECGGLGFDRDTLIQRYREVKRA